MFGHAGGHPFVKFDYQLNDMEVAILTNHSEHFRGTHSFTTCAPEQRCCGKITDSMCATSPDSATEHRSKKLWTATARWLVRGYRTLGQLPELVPVFVRDRRQGREAFVHFALYPWPQLAARFYQGFHSLQISGRVHSRI